MKIHISIWINHLLARNSTWTPEKPTELLLCDASALAVVSKNIKCSFQQAPITEWGICSVSGASSSTQRQMFFQRRFKVPALGVSLSSHSTWRNTNNFKHLNDAWIPPISSQLFTHFYLNKSFFFFFRINKLGSGSCFSQNKVSKMSSHARVHRGI